MLLYWAIFTLGFWAGTILSFVLFAAKKPEEEKYGIDSKQPLESQLSSAGLTFAKGYKSLTGEIKGNKEFSETLLSARGLDQSHQQKVSLSN